MDLHLYQINFVKLSFIVNSFTTSIIITIIEIIAATIDIMFVKIIIIFIYSN